MACACGRIDFDPRAGDGGVDGPDTPPVLRQTHYLKASNTDAFDQFGFASAVSADGSTVVVTGWIEDGGSSGVDGDQDDDSRTNAGAAYVFIRAGSTWVQEAYIKASNPDPSDAFGVSAALSASGDTLAVGAWEEDSGAMGVDGNQVDNAAANAGAVYVFERTGSTWVQGAYLKASNSGAQDRFGQALALAPDGATLVVGAPGEASAPGAPGSDDSRPDAGAAYVFARVGTTWVQRAFLKSSNADADDAFGTSVAITADARTLAIGAPGEASRLTDRMDNSAPAAGAVYILSATPGGWEEVEIIKAPNADTGDAFGERVALTSNGATLAVGAPREDSNARGPGGDPTDNSATDAGAVYIFDQEARGFAPVAYLKSSNSDPADQFGEQMAIAASGAALLVTTHFEASAAAGADGDQNDNSMPAAGAGYFFTRADGLWQQQQYLKASNPHPFDFFGFGPAISTDGTVAVIGAVQEASAATGLDGDQTDTSAPQAGAAYIFE